MVSLVREKGIALVAVLWVVALLATMAASVSTHLRTDVDVTFNEVASAQARAMADAGIYRVLAMLVGQPGERAAAAGSVDSSMLQREDIAPLIRRHLQTASLLSPGSRLPQDGTEYLWPFADGVVRLSVRSEGGKIDLNGAGPRLLRGLLQAAGLDGQQAGELTDRLMDYRDRDSQRRLLGAEDADYPFFDLSHTAKDRPFERIDELLQLPGMTRQLYQEIAPQVTVYSGSPGIDPRTASPATLRAVPSMTEQGIQDLLATRRLFEAGNRIMVPSDNPAFVGTPTDVVTIRAEAETLGGAVFVREAVVLLKTRSQALFRIIEWKQGRRTTN